ncbi:MAG TPA: hypothetical protein VEI02_07450 [Planctomycetota bacterium]|nr:hypothetical protein [Planctomycetota bacterium]
MTRTGIVLAAIIAGAATAGATWWASRAAASNAGSRTAEDAGGAERAPNASARPTASSRVARDAFGPASPTTPRPGDDAVLRTLRVVHHADGRPARGARVTVVADDAVFRAAARELGGAGGVPGGSTALDARLGATAVADDAGIVRLTTRRTPLRASARLDAFGVERSVGVDAGTEDDVVELRLTYRPTVRVRVLRHDGGAAAGADVQAAALRPGGGTGPRIASGATGVDGLATLALDLPSGAAVQDEFLTFEVTGAFSTPPSTKVPAAPLPEEVVISLPPTGAVVVRTIDVEGRPIAADGEAELRCDHGRGPATSPISTPVALAPVRDGVARFPCAEAGATLAVRVRFDDGRSGATRGVGPPREGETTLYVAPGPPPPGLWTIVARFRDEHGATVEAADVEILAHDAEDAVAARATAPVVGGLLRTTVLPSTRAAPARVRFTRIDGPTGLTSAAAPPEDADGVSDFGELRFDVGPPMAAGIVVDESGAPAAGARIVADVRVRERSGARESGTLTAVASSTGSFVLGAGSRDVRDRVLFLTASLPSADGEAVAEPVQCSRGATGVVLTVRRRGVVEGSVQTDASRRARGWVFARRSDVPDASWGSHAPLRRDGTFRIEGLLPGAYAVGLLSGGADGLAQNRPELIVEGVLVRGGETTRDPRLQDLPLEPTGPTVRIAVVDDAGRTARQARVFATVAGTRVRAMPHDDGALRVTLDAPSADLVVVEPSGRFLPARLDAVDGDRRVTLRRGPRIYATLGAHELPPGVRLSGGWRPTSAVVPASALPFAFLGMTGEFGVESTCCGPGPYRWTYVLTRADGFGTGGTLECGFEVTDASEVQRFTLVVPKDVLDAALARLLDHEDR